MTLKALNPASGARFRAWRPPAYVKYSDVDAAKTRLACDHTVDRAPSGATRSSEVAVGPIGANFVMD